MGDDTISKRSPSPGFFEDIRPRKLTLTKAPANKEEFLLTKSKEQTMDIFEILESTEAENEDELVKSLEEAGKSEEAIEAVKTAARAISAFSDDIEGDELRKALEAVGYEFDVDTDTDTDTDTDDDVSKSDDDVDTADMSEVEKALAERDETIDELQKRLDELESERNRDEWVEKASEVENLPGDAEEVGETLKTVAESAGREAAMNMLDKLRAADKQVEKADELGREFGRAGGGATTEVEKTAELEKKAQEIADERDVNMYEAKKIARRETDIFDAEE